MVNFIDDWWTLPLMATAVVFINSLIINCVLVLIFWLACYRVYELEKQLERIKEVKR